MQSTALNFEINYYSLNYNKKLKLKVNNNQKYKLNKNNKVNKYNLNNNNKKVLLSNYKSK